MAQVRVGNKGSFTCQPEDTILAAGQRAGFGFPKACRNGNCGRCAGQLLNGCVALPQSQQSQINNPVKTDHVVCAGQLGSDTVLYCIAKALSDCDIAEHLITAPGELPVNTLRCQIADIHPLNYNVSAVTLRLPAGQRIHWYAGQYLLLGEQQEAAFSIANSVTDDSGRELLLHIRHEEGNASALALMAELKEHATVLATLPLGERYIDQAPQQPVWFICGSTGFAPARAMIERLAQLQFDLPVRLFRGGRRFEDIYPSQWPAHTLERLKDFQEVIAIDSSPVAGYFHGMVHEAALATLAASEQPTAPLFHVGGSPAMVWATFDALVAAGVPATQIHSDVFDYAPRES